MELAMMKDIEFEEKVDIDDLVLPSQPMKSAEIKINDIKQEPLEEGKNHYDRKKFRLKLEEKVSNLYEELDKEKYENPTNDFGLKRSLLIRQFVEEISEQESVNHQMKSEIVSLKTKLMEITEEHETTMSLNTKTMNSIVKMHEEALGDKRNELANIKQELQRVNVTNQELLQKIQGFEKNQELEMNQNTFANCPQDPKDLQDDPQDLDENLQDIALNSNVQDGKFKDKVKKDPTKIYLCTLCKEFKSNNLYILGRHQKSCEKKFKVHEEDLPDTDNNPEEHDTVLKENEEALENEGDEDEEAEATIEVPVDFEENEQEEANEQEVLDNEQQSEILIQEDPEANGEEDEDDDIEPQEPITEMMEIAQEESEETANEEEEEEASEPNDNEADHDNNASNESNQE